MAAYAGTVLETRVDKKLATKAGTNLEKAEVYVVTEAETGAETKVET